MATSRVNGTRGKPGQGFLVLGLFAAVFFGTAIVLVGGVISGLFLAVIVASVAALANYRIGLWFLILLLPLSATSIFPHQMFGITGANPYNVLFGLTLLSFFGKQALKGKRNRDIAYPRFWWAYVAPIMLAALIGSRHVGEIPAFAYLGELVRFTSAAGYFRDVLIKPFTYLLLALLLGVAVRDGMKPTNAITAMCLSIWLLGAWIFSYVALSGVGADLMAASSARGLLTRTGMHANEIGIFAAFALTLMIFAMASPDRNAGLRCLYVMTAGISAVLLLISFSRGGFLAFLVGLVVFFVVQRRVRVIAVGVFLLLLIIPLLPSELYERLAVGLYTGGSQVLYSNDDPLTAGRVAGVWIPLLSEVEVQPLFGNGLLAVAWSMPFRSGALVLQTLNPHSMYLKILLEVGLVGFVLLGFFFVGLWRRFRAAARDAATPAHLAWLFEGAAAALVGYGAFGMSGGDYLPNPLNALLWVVFGLLLAFPPRHLNVEKEREAMENPRRREVACAS